MDLVELAVQAVDGTKVRANAANDRTYDDEALRRLLKRSERTICGLKAQIEAAAEGKETGMLITAADPADAGEGGGDGGGQGGDDVGRCGLSLR